MAGARSARGRLLFRGRHGNGADLANELGGVDPFARGGPVLRGELELEVAVARPERDETDELREIDLRVEPVQLSGGDEGEEVGGGARVVVGAEEEPVLPAHAEQAKGKLAVVVGQRQAAVVEEAREGVLLADGVAAAEQAEQAEQAASRMIAARRGAWRTTFMS